RPPRDTHGCAGSAFSVAFDEISSEGLRRTAPSAVTPPAAIAACALARLSNRPRSTRTMSARLRVISGPPDDADLLAAERLEHLRDDALGVETGPGVHRVRRILIDEGIGQHHPAHLEIAA